jgi:cobalt-zinc-cadmium resistance protein CzcA
VTRVFSRIGTSEVATDPMPPNETDLYIVYRPLSEWPKTPGRPTTKQELCEQVDKAVNAATPGQEFEFGQPIEMRFNEMLEGSKSELSVNVYGTDFEVLERLAREVNEVIQSVPGGESTLEVDGRTSTLTLRVRRGELVRRNVASARWSRGSDAATSSCGFPTPSGPTSPPSATCPSGSGTPVSSPSESWWTSTRSRPSSPSSTRGSSGGWHSWSG